MKTQWFSNSRGACAIAASLPYSLVNVSPMKASLIPATELTSAQLTAWSDLQRSNESLASPYFRPEFTLMTSAVRNDVSVVVLEQGGETVGFWPLQIYNRRMCRPVGYPMNDTEGAITSDGLVWCPAEVMRSVGLQSYRFRKIPVSQTAFAPYHCVTNESPYADLQNGFQSYLSERRAAGTEEIAKTLRKLRSAEREFGSVRLETSLIDHGLLDQLIASKDAQCRRTGAPRLFELPWPGQLLHRILDCTGEEFAGVLSALYFGDKIAALLFSVRSAGILQAWFPTYEPPFARYSPGMGLFVSLFKTASETGIHRVELGKGNERFKRSLRTGVTHLVEGCIDSRPAAAAMYRGYLRARASVRSSAFCSLGLRAYGLVCATRRHLGYSE